MVLAAAISLSDEVGTKTENTIPGQPIEYGIAAFVALLLLLWIITRLNATR
jgi:hypothetical protein